MLLLFSLLAARLITNPLGGGARSITPTPTPRNGIGIETVTITENHHSEKINIGIADGQHVQFESPTNSAEVCIDGANPQNNPNNDVPTVIVVTTLSNTSVDKGDSLDIGNEELQGICLWQKDFQKYNHTSEPLRVLVANIGTKETNVLDTTVPLVTGQIIKFAASHPKNFLGVVGFSFSQSVQDAMGTLNANHIPVISPAASSSDFSAEWAYFNRVIPSNQLQGDIAATYAKGVLHATTAFVFLDTKTNPYSKTLGISFINELRSDGSSVTPEYYTVNDPATFDNGINDVLTKYREGSGPAVVFCSCYASDFVALHKWQGKTIPKGLIFMGGEGLYELGSYSGNYTDIYFTAYAYPDTIKILCQGQQESQCTQEQENFLADYCQQFDPQDYKLDTVKLQYCGKYGVSRPGPHVIQTYDAISALQQAYNQAKKTVQAPSKENIQSALNQLSFEGISGQINLTQGDPNNKAILVLCVDSNHLTHLVGVYGQFFQNSSSQPQISLDNVCA
ncbi:MAG TPA: ABC transporter substrate-binding protein [Ktedonobacteraceae bacterium]